MSLITLFACLLTAVLTASLTLWLTRDSTPPVPNLMILERLVDQVGDRLVMLGGWVIDEGYKPPGRSAIEIRCYAAQQLCTEAVASIFHHAEGSDLEAQTYLYQVTDWTAERVQAVAIGGMGECLERRLQLFPQHTDARLEWGQPRAARGRAGQPCWWATNGAINSAGVWINETRPLCSRAPLHNMEHAEQ